MADGRIPGPELGRDGWYWPEGLIRPTLLAPPGANQGRFALPGPLGTGPGWMPGGLRIGDATWDPVSTRTMQAMAVAAHFERWRPAGVFTRIRAADVAAGLRQRLAYPATIDQGRSSLCGPAVFVYRVLANDPLEYVNFVVNLYTRGSATLGKLTVTAGPDLRNYDPKIASMDAADWIPLASIRDSDNWFFDYQSADKEFAGITLPSHLERWFRKIGYRQVINKTSLTHDESAANLREADQLHASGHWVCLFINANALSKATQNDISMVPNHWVVLRSRIAFTPFVSFEIFTWGQGRYTVPEDPASKMSIEDFLDHYHGFVAAKF
jgi:hypothetical protein